ncbi:MAG: hypothetical protein V3T23_01390 [Nitrososphaerales archaeon]
MALPKKKKKKKKKKSSPAEDQSKTGNKRTSHGQFLKGGKGGPGRKPGAKLRIKRCAKFMDAKGWKELEWYAMNRANPKVAVDALKTIAAYGYGKPPELIELSDSGEARTIADFFASGKIKDK